MTTCASTTSRVVTTREWYGTNTRRARDSARARVRARGHGEGFESSRATTRERVAREVREMRERARERVGGCVRGGGDGEHGEHHVDGDGEDGAIARFKQMEAEMRVEMERERRRAEDVERDARARRETLEEELRAVREVVVTLERAVLDGERAREEARERYERDIGEMREDAARATRERDEDAERAQSDIERIEHEREDVRAALERALEVQGELEQRLDVASERHKDARREVEGLARELDEATRRTSALMSEKADAERRVDELVVELAALHEEKRVVEGRLDEAERNAGEVERETIAAMQRELDEARAALANALDDKDVVEKRIDEINREIVMLSEENSSVKRDLAEMSARMDVAAEHNASLLAELERVDADAAKTAGDDIEALKRELEGAVKGRTAALEDAQRLGEMLQQAKRDVADAELENARLREDLANAEASGNTDADVKLFEQLVKAQQEEIDELHEIVNTLTLQTNALMDEAAFTSEESQATRDIDSSRVASPSQHVDDEAAPAPLVTPAQIPEVVVPAETGIDAQVAAHVRKVKAEVEEHLLLALESEAADFVGAQEAASRFASLNAARFKDGVYYFVGDVRAGQRARVLYNRHTPSPMSRDGQCFIHVGFDNWVNGAATKTGMTPLPHDSHDRNVDHRVRDQGDWWVVEFPVPEGAATIDFVFSDADNKFDNNANGDYHCGISDGKSREEKIAARIAAQRKAKQGTMEKSIARAGQRAAKLMRSRAEALAHAEATATLNRVYTTPYQPAAGGEATIHYRPEGGPLTHAGTIYCQGSWNRWNHPYDFGPLEMHASDDAPGTFELTLHVPSDAHVMDFVFTDRDVPGAGAYDSNDRADYHATIVGGTGHAPKLHIVHIAVEMAPIAKVGGMGDVVTALARATMEDGHDVDVIVPKYDCMDYTAVDGLHRIGSVKHDNVDVDVYRGWVEDVPTTFLHPRNGFFDVGCIYGRGDDHVRFGFFSAAALTWMRSRNEQVDIIHAHDWQTAPVVWGKYPKAVTALTLHNLQFGVDLIKRGMEACDIATTVSPTYANEVRDHGAVQHAQRKFVGIRNGIDTDIWDPSVDEFLPLTYDASTVTAGKRAAVAALSERLKLNHPEGAPVVGVVSRLTAQKGIHLIKHACHRALERGATFVLLGSAPDGAHQHEFNMLAQDMANKYPGRSGFMFKYDEAFSHMMYAGCDFLLVPSMFEPCGLTQMIAMRYGAVPVVRSTGGLRDTVFDVDNDADRASSAGLSTNGFSFDGTQTSDMDYALNRALDAYYDKPRWSSLALPKRVMTQDWSWRAPAKLYVDRYWRAVKKKRESSS